MNCVNLERGNTFTHLFFLKDSFNAEWYVSGSPPFNHSVCVGGGDQGQIVFYLKVTVCECWQAVSLMKKKRFPYMQRFSPYTPSDLYHISILLSSCIRHIAVGWEYASSLLNIFSMKIAICASRGTTNIASMNNIHNHHEN